MSGRPLKNGAPAAIPSQPEPEEEEEDEMYDEVVSSRPSGQRPAAPLPSQPPQQQQQQQQDQEEEEDDEAYYEVLTPCHLSCQKVTSLNFSISVS